MFISFINECLFSSFLFAGKAVTQEVKSILSPLPMQSHFGSSMIERRPHRKGKAKLAQEKYSGTPRGRKPAAHFQKKLVVIDYMGPKAPRKFGIKEMYVFMRGLLPQISLGASEDEIREIIINTIRDSESKLSELSSRDFEFLEATGKCLEVPACQTSLE